MLLLYGKRTVQIVMQHVLEDIAKRLPLAALVKFAKATDQTCIAAREAWQTWKTACDGNHYGRMFSDRSWMDTYTRNVRQVKFRTVNAAEQWFGINAPPAWVEAALHYALQLVVPVTFALRVRKDYTVMNVLLFRQNKLWLVISSAGNKSWRFEESLADISAEQRAAAGSMLRGLLITFERHGLQTAPLQPPAVASYDKSLPHDEAAARLHCTRA